MKHPPPKKNTGCAPMRCRSDLNPPKKTHRFPNFPLHKVRGGSTTAHTLDTPMDIRYAPFSSFFFLSYSFGRFLPAALARPVADFTDHPKRPSRTRVEHGNKLHYWNHIFASHLNQSASCCTPWWRQCMSYDRCQTGAAGVSLAMLPFWTNQRLPQLDRKVGQCECGRVQ